MLFLQQESQDLGLLLLQGLGCLALLNLHLLTLYNHLVVLFFFPRFHFIVFFLQVFRSKFAILFKFFSKKTNHTFKLHLLLCFYPQCHFHLAAHVFMSLQIFPLVFSNFLSFLFFVLDIDCLFGVSALVLRLLSPNLSIMSSRSCLFSDSSSPPRPLFLISSLVLTCTFSWG